MLVVMLISGTRDGRVGYLGGLNVRSVQFYVVVNFQCAWTFTISGEMLYFFMCRYLSVCFCYLGFVRAKKKLKFCGWQYILDVLKWPKQVSASV